MSYQVLARKWRPQNFKQMVGQEHVLQALIHALDSQRLHHAYLFTGTRGVGKTTIGRILAKCLSCEDKITSEPCGQCAACVAISEGRYVDLIEIDAASRTKVEDMRELLENVQYAPSQGRFKIYLIDEVHMLSQSSFNALLKTLEEPPSHVKFLFATTDPQKLPVTILSRCLQFNLKNMSPEKIVAHLKQVLTEERVNFEDAALWALARAAEGSMRDALSLTDQAIAYGNHTLSETGVSTMLGTVDQKKVYRILDALIQKDAARMLIEVQSLADFSPDYRSVLAALSAILHRIALEQVVPGSVDNAMGDQAQIQHYAKVLCAEDVQLFYQIALTSRQDLQITPDAKSGFEMALLRMLAFQMTPVAADSQQTLPVSQVVEDHSIQSDTEHYEANASEPLEHGESLIADTRPVHPINNEIKSEPEFEGEAHNDEQQTPEDLNQGIDSEASAEISLAQQEASQESSTQDSGQIDDTALFEAENTEKKKPVLSREAGENIGSWNAQVNELGLSGMTLNFLLNSVLEFDAPTLNIFVETGHFRLINENHERRIKEALLAYFQDYSEVVILDGLQPGHESPMMWRERQQQEKKEHARALIMSDPHVDYIVREFEANLIEASIQPEA